MVTRTIVLAVLLCSCGRDKQTSSFSRLINYKITELTKTVSAGDAHSCAILVTTGILKCWGDNRYGQIGLGEGDQAPQKTPVVVPLGSGRRIRAVSAGTDHSCAIPDDGSLWCWGHNQYGQIGDGSTDPRPSPTPVNLGEDRTAKAVSTGNGHSCAILDDGSLKCWGYNQHGQIGDGSADPRLVPTTVELGDDKTAKTVSLGGYHSCAILNDGSLKCWGDNRHGQIGDGSTDPRHSPTAINLGDNRTASALDAGGDHTCVLLDGDHSPVCWGLNDSGQLGDKTSTSRSSPTPVHLLSGHPAEALSLGHRHSCALMKNGILYCWGANSDRQLGDGSTEPRSYPVAPNLGDHTSVRVAGAGGKHTCAIVEDDSLVCWGNNTSGRLGDGSDNTTDLPVAVKL